MKCRYCDNEAVYPDGLCERCHQAEMESRGASVLSDDGDLDQLFRAAVAGKLI